MSRTSSSSSSSAYDLYLDESGRFLETSTDAAERAGELSAGRRPFASQLAGLLVRRGALEEGDARKLMRRVLSHAPMPSWPHARDVPAGPAFDGLVSHSVAALRDAGA